MNVNRLSRTMLSRADAPATPSTGSRASGTPSAPTSTCRRSRSSGGSRACRGSSIADSSRTSPAHGIEAWMYDVLATLRRSGEPYELAAGDLVRQTMVTTGAITNRVDRLEERGLVERHTTDDRRKVIVRLTDKGLDLVDSVAVPRISTPSARSSPSCRLGSSVSSCSSCARRCWVSATSRSRRAEPRGLRRSSAADGLRRPPVHARPSRRVRVGRFVARLRGACRRTIISSSRRRGSTGRPRLPR